jgi:hypothetical protein
MMIDDGVAQHLIEPGHDAVVVADLAGAAHAPGVGLL